MALSPWEKTSCCLTMGLALQSVPARLLEQVALAASPAGLAVLFSSDFTLGGGISAPEWQRICQSLRLACCHQGHYIISSLTGGAGAEEQSAGGAGDMNSPLFAVPSPGDRSGEALRARQPCVEARNESSTWWDQEQR